MKKAKNEELNQLYETQKIVLNWLLGIIYFSFFTLQLGRVQAIADFNVLPKEVSPFKRVKGDSPKAFSFVFFLNVV